ncbi:hypothetical protein SAMN04487819_109219 [Actinopolyspora alba]|uniref:RanBP2-type domain-containing protein n=1 Tax=Actinopolyspora alba TaxID=673379 RepID=A0A1I1YU47_9ACTN|nr:hypothetical protein [Actinopolyspora alba]SFE22518.1 hypothetical protein SAMN04487819_109219 [Actinopolyspora alba]
MHAVTSTLAALLTAADEHDEPVIRRAAHHARLLWGCRCRTDNPRRRHLCDGCGSALEDVGRPGMLDPTGGGIGRRDDTRCAAVNQDGSRCTRTTRHLGHQHVAGDGDVIRAVWEWHHAVEITTPDGPAVLTVVRIERSVDCAPTRSTTVFGDRVVVRSRQDGDTDRYAVFEHVYGHPWWHSIAENLRAADLHAPIPRNPSSATKPRWFDDWLHHIVTSEYHAPSATPGQR